MSTVTSFPFTNNKNLQPERDEWEGVPYDELPHAVKKIRFKPPIIGVGDPVAYYINGDKNATPAFGFVARVSGRCLEINVISNGQFMHRSSVFHIDDPRLDDSHEIRKHGAWNYTEHQQKIDDLCNRIERLENALMQKCQSDAEEKYGKREDENPEPVDPVRAAYEAMNRSQLVEWAEQSSKLEPGPTWNKPTLIKRLMEAEVAPPEQEVSDEG